MRSPDVPCSRLPTHSASSGLPVQMFTAMTAIAARMQGSSRRRDGHGAGDRYRRPARRALRFADVA